MNLNPYFLTICIAASSIPAAAQVTLTNEDVENGTHKKIPLIKWGRSVDGSAPPARTNRPSPTRESRSLTTGGDPVSNLDSSAWSAEQRLRASLADLAQEPHRFDVSTYSGIVPFRGDFSFVTPQLPPGNYCFVFASDERSAKLLERHAIGVTIRRNDNVLAGPMMIREGYHNFRLFAEESLAFEFELPADYWELEGHLAFRVVVVPRAMKLRFSPQTPLEPERKLRIR